MRIYIHIYTVHKENSMEMTVSCRSVNILLYALAISRHLIISGHLKITETRKCPPSLQLNYCNHSKAGYTKTPNFREKNKEGHCCETNQIEEVDDHDMGVLSRISNDEG